jgi:hypothetical protein
MWATATMGDALGSTQCRSSTAQGLASSVHACEESYFCAMVRREYCINFFELYGQLNRPFRKTVAGYGYGYGYGYAAPSCQFPHCMLPLPPNTAGMHCTLPQKPDWSMPPCRSQRLRTSVDKLVIVIISSISLNKIGSSTHSTQPPSLRWCCDLVLLGAGSVAKKNCKMIL